MELNNYFVPLVLRYLQLMDVKCDPKELQLVLLSVPSVARMLFFAFFISIGIMFLMKRIVENQAKVFNISKFVLQRI